MRIPRLSVRRLMVTTLVVASVLCVAIEFWEGVPPRSVVRGIPARLNRLKPGMGYRQVEEILGLEKSWLKGGMGAQLMHGGDDGRDALFIYRVRPTKRPPPKPGVAWTEMDLYRSRAMVRLWFDRDPTPKMDGGRKLWRYRLTRASFSSDGKSIAEMPGSH